MDAANIWTLDEASKNLAVPIRRTKGNKGKPQWETAFKEGVTFDEKTTLGKYLTKPVYDTRHDLSFLTPSGRPVRCKVKRKSGVILYVAINITVWIEKDQCFSKVIFRKISTTKCMQSII